MKILYNIFLIIIISVVQTGFAQTKTKTITIDVSRNDKLNISQIAEEVIAIPLKNIPMNEPVMSQLIVTTNYLYVSLAEKGSSGTQMEIFQVKRDGTLIRQIGLKSDETKEFIKATGIFYIESTNELAISYKNYIAVFDENGKLKRKIENISFRDFNQVFNNQVWYMFRTLERENHRYLYTLVSKDLTTYSEDKIYTYEHHISENENVFAGCSFSVANNKLYFTNDYEKEIFSVNSDNQVEKSYQFDFKNLIGNSVDTIIHPGRIVFNNYICFGYRDYSMNNFCFIYNKTNGESYNIKLHMKNGAFVSGINDDIFDTGYFRLNNTNSGDYAFYTKFGYQVSNKIEGIEEESNPVIFLIKLK